VVVVGDGVGALACSSRAPRRSGSLLTSPDCCDHPVVSATNEQRHEVYERELPVRIDAVFRAQVELYDHRRDYAWLTACLGDPFAPVWFVAENPSLTQVERAPAQMPEDQWNVSPGDKLFRRQLVKHGFKRGGVDEPAGWRCYITDIIKSVDRVDQWNRLAEAERHRVAEAWAAVLAWELEIGRPQIVVSVGGKADRLLDHLLRRGLIPVPALRMQVAHYSYIGSRPDARTKLGPGHPERIAAWDEEFEAVIQALRERAQRRVPAAATPSSPPPADERTTSPRPSRPPQRRAAPRRSLEDGEVSRRAIRDAPAAGRTPDQIAAHASNRRAVYLAAIEEEARRDGEFDAIEPTPANVVALRDKRSLRWERIAVRVFGDPRRRREAQELYDAAKGGGAAQQSWTGRGRRFPKMET
jgi:hypothetical protein